MFDRWGIYFVLGVVSLCFLIVPAGVVGLLRLRRRAPVRPGALGLLEGVRVRVTFLPAFFSLSVVLGILLMLLPWIWLAESALGRWTVLVLAGASMLGALYAIKKGGLKWDQP